MLLVNYILQSFQIQISIKTLLCIGLGAEKVKIVNDGTLFEHFCFVKQDGNEAVVPKEYISVARLLDAVICQELKRLKKNV